MHFSKANEGNFQLSFLNVLINRHAGKFCTISWLYLNFKRFVPLVYKKKGLIFCLVFRIDNIYSDWNRIHEKIQKLTCLLSGNKYPIQFIHFCIKFCLNKLIGGSQPKVSTVTKNEFSICLHWLWKIKYGNYSHHNFHPSNSQLFWSLALKLEAFLTLKTFLFVLDRTLFTHFRAVTATLPTSRKLHSTFW